MFQKFMRRTRPAALSVCAALLTATAQAQVTYSYTFPAPGPPVTVLQWDANTSPTGGDPVFHRPLVSANSVTPPTALDNVSGYSYTPYRAQNFTLAASGAYTISISGSLTQSNTPIGLIYKNTFDPNNPLTNIVLGVFGTLNATLAAGNYVFVATSPISGASGSVTATISVTPTFATVFSANGTTAAPGASPLFNKPFPNGNLPPVNTGAGSGASYFYNVDPFTVPTDGAYQLFSDTTVNQLFYDSICLYQNSFDPASPLTNCLQVSGPSSILPDAGYRSSLTANLKAGTQYYFVTSAFYNTTNGKLSDYANTVSPVTVPSLDSWTGTTLGGPTFNRPNQPGANVSTLIPTALSGFNIAYDKHTFTPASDATVTVTSVCTNPASWNNYLLIYDNGFDPASPLTNCIAAADGGYNSAVAPVDYVTQGGFSSIVKVTLNVTAGHTYTIVTSGNLAGSVGAYAGTVTTAPVVGAPVASFNGTLTAGAGGLTYQRPNAGATPTTVPTTISNFAIPSSADSFTIAAEGDYKIVSAAAQPPQWALYLILYRDSFDPNSPLTNAIAAVGSNNTAATIPQIHLTPGTYYAVTSGLGSLSEGAYLLTVQQYGDTGTRYSYSAGALNAGTGPTFSRPAPGVPPTALSGNTGIYYDAHPFTVPTTGVYNFDAVSDTVLPWDDFVTLYQNSFNPASPLTNAIAANDSVHLAGSDAGLRNLQLTAGTPYIMVASGFSFNQFGAYHGNLYTGGGEYPPVIPDAIAAGISATLTAPDHFSVAGLSSVTITGLYHPHLGDLTATLSHNGVSIEIFDRVNRTTTSGAGAASAFNGQDYTFEPASAGGRDLGAAAAAAGSGAIDPAAAYAPFLNGTAGQSSMLTGDFTAFNGMSVNGDWTLNIADLSASYRGYFSGFKFRVTPSGAPLTGSVALEGVPDLSLISPYSPLGTFHVSLRAPGSLTEKYGYDVTLNATAGAPTGSFTIPNVVAGTYDIVIGGMKNLAVLTPNVVVGASGGTVSPAIPLPAGDANGDNSVDSSDFGILIGAFNTDGSVTGSGYDPAADFNFDGIVDSSDFGLLIGEFNNIGAQ